MQGRVKGLKRASEDRQSADHGGPPERRCIVSQRARPAAELVRFVTDPEDRVVADIAGKLPGRGIWVSADRSAVETAVRKRLFSRAARRTASADAELPDQVEELLARSALGLLGLARRAGQVVTGFDQVADALDGGQAAVVLTASDAAKHGRSKIAAKLHAGGNRILNVELFDRGELSLALGRENVVHAALRAGGLSAKFVAECGRLAGFRASGPGDADPAPTGAGTIGAPRLD